MVTNVNKNTNSSNYAVKKVAICFVGAWEMKTTSEFPTRNQTPNL